MLDGIRQKLYRIPSTQCLHRLRTAPSKDSIKSLYCTDKCPEKQNTPCSGPSSVHYISFQRTVAREEEYINVPKNKAKEHKRDILPRRTHSADRSQELFCDARKEKNTTHQKEETESRQLFRYGWLDSGAINGMAERSRGIGAEGVGEVEVEVEVGVGVEMRDQM